MCDIFRTQHGSDLGWPSSARSACSFPGDAVAEESHSNGIPGSLICHSLVVLGTKRPNVFIAEDL